MQIVHMDYYFFIAFSLFISAKTKGLLYQISSPYVCLHYKPFFIDLIFHLVITMT